MLVCKKGKAVYKKEVAVCKKGMTELYSDSISAQKCGSIVWKGEDKIEL